MSDEIWLFRPAIERGFAAMFWCNRGITAARVQSWGVFRNAAYTAVDRGAGRLVGVRGPALQLERLRVIGETEVSLELTGPPNLLDRVSALGVRVPPSLPFSAGALAVQTTCRRRSGSVWLTGSLPTELFASGNRVVLVVTTASGRALRLSVPRRNALVHSWSRDFFAAHRWPIRVRLDLRNRLIACGRRPQTVSPCFDIEFGADGVVVKWRDPDTRSSVVRLERAGDGAALATRCAGSFDGVVHSVALELPALVGEWSIQVLSAGQRPVPLELPRGRYPVLERCQTFPEVRLETKDGRPLVALAHYTAANVLAISVREISENAL